MDFKIRGIDLVKWPLTWQHTTFQPRDSAGISLLHRKCEAHISKDKPLPTSQNPFTPLNVPKQVAADFVFNHRICGCSFFSVLPIVAILLRLNSSKIQMKWKNDFVEMKHEETYAPEYQRQVRYQFESFCRKVIHSEHCDYLRHILRRMEHETNIPLCPKPFSTAWGTRRIG